MKDEQKHRATKTKPQPRVVSIRLIVTVVAVLLISAAVVGAGAVSERNARRALMQALETRLALEARNLSTISSNALLTDYPELTLHPIVKEMETERPDLESVVVVDHEQIIQGHSDASRLGTKLNFEGPLKSRVSTVALTANEELLENDELLMLKTSILHANGSPMGQVIVGLKRSHVEAMLVAARKNQIVFFLPLLAVSVLLTMLLMSRLLHPISAIRSVIEKIGRGDLDTRVEVSSRTELSLVARSINDMAGRLKSAQAELLEKERLDHEMQLAHEIQHSLLPKRATELGDLLIVGAQQAAAEVGGDYYDVFPLPDGRLGIVIADVAGKGLGGCLVTSMLAVLIRTLRTSYSSPSNLIIAVHEGIIDSLPPARFITMFYGLIDPRTGRLTFASAGHNPLLHYKAASRTIVWHRTRGIPVGMVKDDSLRETIRDDAIVLEPGDLALQTTDGFHEAFNENMDEYGFGRVADTVKSFAERGGRAVIDSIQRSVADWEGSQPANDDKTLVAITRAPAAVSATTATATRNDRVDIPSKLSALWSNRERGDFLSVPARLETFEDIGIRLRRCPGLEHTPESELSMLEQGLYEVLANVIEHGCSLDESKTVDVWWIDYPSQSSRGFFLIRDEGSPPTPERWSASKAHRSRGRGYGLKLIEQTLAHVEFVPSTQEGNLTLVHAVIPQRVARATE